MRIYKVETECSQEGSGVNFHSSKLEATKWGKQYVADMPEWNRTFHVEPIDFKPTKKGILALLATHAPFHDNG